MKKYFQLSNYQQNTLNHDFYGSLLTWKTPLQNDKEALCRCTGLAKNHQYDREVPCILGSVNYTAARQSMLYFCSH